MEPFRTVLNAGESAEKLSLADHVVTCGSCFSEAIGQRLQKYKINTLVNPFGNIYNPLSIHKALLYAIYGNLPGDQTYLRNQGVWLNYDFHSEFSSTDKSVLSAQIKESIDDVHSFLKNARWLFITYGTSWVYEEVGSASLVANCHKMPSGHFRKFLLTQKKIIESFNELHSSLKAFNPNARIIITVSPVRHVKDTLQLNSVSKSLLRLSCHTLGETFDNVEYFPSYEIMMDDLRDYRFYKTDMLHPTEEAEDYIWKMFTAKYFDGKTQGFADKWKSILTALSHKPFHPSSDSHQRFLKETLARLQELKPLVNVDREMALIKQQITEGHA